MRYAYGAPLAITLSLVSFLGVWIIKEDATIGVRMMTLAVTSTIRHYDYASIPTFVMMGLIVGKTGFGSDIYQVANQIFRKLRGGLGSAHQPALGKRILCPCRSN